MNKINKKLNGQKGFRLDYEKLILKFLANYGPTSRQKVCETFNLLDSTASYIMKRLRKKRLITETKGKSKARGPKPIVVSINPKGGFIFSVILSPSCLSIGLFALNLELIQVTETPIRKKPLPENVSKLLQTSLSSLMDKHHISKSNLAGIGLALPGQITPDGIIKNSSTLKWKNVPFKKMMSSYFDCPIVTCKITAKSLFSDLAIFPAFRQETVLYVSIRQGLGGALAIEGKVIEGGSNVFAEIGHIVVDPNGPVCGCGRKGCMETLISGPALSKRIKNDIKKGTQTLLTKQVKRRDTPKEVIEKWGQAIKNKDNYSLELRNFLVNNLGKIIVIAINCFDPNVILLGGYVAEQCPDFLTQKLNKKIATEICGKNRKIKIITVPEDVKSLTLSIARTTLLEIWRS